MKRNRKDPPNRGFTLVELLVSIAVMAFVMAGAGGLYLAHKNAQTAEDLSQTLDAQLRLGMDVIMFDLRSAGYGVSSLPNSNMAAWIPWVSGMTADPLITTGSDANHPDTISIALCTSQPIGTFAAAYTAGASTFTIDTAGAAAVNTANMRLIYINDGELAQVSAKSGTTITPDTNPTVSGPQALTKSYNIGTPICRVDAITISVCPPVLVPPVTCPTGIPANTLYMDTNQGTTPNPQVIVNGISNMKIVSTAAPSGGKAKYQVTLTATSSAADPLSTASVQRSLTSTASKRN